MSDAKKILIVATSAADMGTKDHGSTGSATGLWLEELTTPDYSFVDAGAEVTLASIAGGAIPIDPRSLDEEAQKAASVQRYHRDAAWQDAVAKTPSVDSVDATAFDAVFLPGGHGTMFDLPQSTTLADMVARTLEDGRIVAAVCHGPAGLVSAKTKDGAPLVKGRIVAGFTDSEERAVGLDQAVPFLLESRLRALGADYRKGPDFESFAVQDGGLITGQNPGSAEEVADLVIKALA